MTDATLLASLAAMVAIGLLGAGHCIGMCGGIASALGFAARDGGGTHLVLGYNLGRVTSYALAGALVALLGQWGSSYLTLGPILRTLSGVILILMGCYLAGWWRVLVRLEKVGGKLWKRIQPLGAKLLPVRSLPQALALGMLWGWLPCGLVYTALAYAAASAQVVDGALLMIAFGVGTAPAMVMGGLFAARARAFLQSKAVRTVAALAMVVFGIWTLAGVAAHWQHSAAHTQSGAHHHH
ncbi:MAG: sulfite exporter TauE/SafE family protein [Porticoccaceae bacterium]